MNKVSKQSVYGEFIETIYGEHARPELCRSVEVHGIAIIIAIIIICAAP